MFILLKNNVLRNYLSLFLKIYRNLYVKILRFRNLKNKMQNNCVFTAFFNASKRSLLSFLSASSRKIGFFPNGFADFFR